MGSALYAAQEANRDTPSLPTRIAGLVPTFRDPSCSWCRDTAYLSHPLSESPQTPVTSRLSQAATEAGDRWLSPVLVPGVSIKPAWLKHRVALRLSVSVAVRAHWDRADSRTMKGTQESSAIGHPVF